MEQVSLSIKCLSSLSLLADKCLAPYYGSCDESRLCENSRFGVNCGGCFDTSMVDIVGQSACGSKSYLGINIEILSRGHVGESSQG